MRFFVSALFLFVSSALGLGEDAKAAPTFFLLDTADQLCLDGEEFKRCSINTVFYVVGNAGE